MSRDELASQGHVNSAIYFYLVRVYLVLLKLAGTVLNMINTSPCYSNALTFCTPTQSTIQRGPEPDCV